MEMVNLCSGPLPLAIWTVRIQWQNKDPRQSVPPRKNKLRHQVAVDSAIFLAHLVFCFFGQFPNGRKIMASERGGNKVQASANWLPARENGQVNDDLWVCSSWACAAIELRIAPPSSYEPDPSGHLCCRISVSSTMISSGCGEKNATHNWADQVLIFLWTASFSQWSPPLSE